MKTRLARVSQKRRVSGFTMIETLIVVAIVLILAAVAMPTVSGLLEKGKETRCLSNLRQWASLIATYTGENNGKFPQAEIPSGAGKITWNHFDAPLASSLKSSDTSRTGLERWKRGDDINGCPSHQNAPHGSNGYTRRYYSYLINSELSNLAVTKSELGPITIQNPNKLIMLIDGTQSQTRTDFFRDNYKTAIGYIHRGERANALFVDGHIASVDTVELQNVVP